MQYSLIITATTSLVLLTVVSAVPQPENVTLQCRNFQSTLYWNYSQLSLENLRFRIDINQGEGFQDPIWVNAPDLSCDLSFLHNTPLNNDFSVSVTAVVGETDNVAPEPENTVFFTYYNGAMEDYYIVCMLDLPSVNVTVPKEGEINYSFTHPSKVYSKEGRLTKFTYSVQTKGQKEEEVLDMPPCDTEVCTGTVHVNKSLGSYCVTINGDWDGIRVVPTKEEYCANTGPPADTTNLKLAAILCPLALLIIALIGWMVFHKLTSPSDSDKPGSLNFNNARRQESLESQVVESPTTSTAPLLSQVHVEVDNQGVSSVLDGGDGGESEMVHEPCYDSGRNLDVEEVDNKGVSRCPGGYESRPPCEGGQAQNEIGQESGYDSGRVLDGEEVDNEGVSRCPGGYESRPACQGGQGQSGIGQESGYDTGRALDEEAAYDSGRVLDGKEVDNGCPDGYESRPACESRSSYESRPTCESRPTNESQPSCESRSSYESRPACESRLTESRSSYESRPACESHSPNESRSPYKPRERLTVEFSPGDEVDAYRG